MSQDFNKKFKNKSFRDRVKDIDPDEIFLDSENLPKFDINQFEGRLEKPISLSTFWVFGVVILSIFSVFFYRSFELQVVNGQMYFERSEKNRLKSELVFSNRGVIYDRNDKKLAWNISDEDSDFSLRKYTDLSGIGHVLGYIKYPMKDKSGFYYSEKFEGKDGVEKYYDYLLSGQNGLRIVEVDAVGAVQSEGLIRRSEDGTDLRLSIDSELQSEMYKVISNLARGVGFVGGSGVIMDVNTGEVIALTSYPEYTPQTLTDGTNRSIINQYLTNTNNPFLDRAIDGLYAPGSIVKPFMSVAALSENIIDPAKKIYSAGFISIPNIYDPSKPTIFKDWKAHGWVDMRHAIAVSSDIYYYAVGGGYEDQKGLGINLIKKYMNMFGFGTAIAEGFFSGKSGTVPDPEWKAANFDGEKWNIGNTYHTSIGQYGFLVSPIQAVRAVASLANDGKLLEPSILLGGNPEKYTKINLDIANMKIAKEGMRLGVVEGVAGGLNVPYVKVAAKTGTAEIGVKKQFVNSWITGYFPYDNPKYAFTIVMERGPVSNTTGGVYAMRQVLDWMSINKPEYFK